MKLYFHVDRAKALKEGDIITKEIYRGESIFASLMPYADDSFLRHIDKLCQNGISIHGAHYLIRPAFDQIIIKDCLLELQLEYIRNIYYKNLPSRLQSIFAFDEYEKALQFKKNNRNYGAIYEIDFAGCFFRADMNWLKFDFSPSMQKQYAMQYWEGKAFSTEKTYDPQWEIVIELPVTIKREITE